MEVKFSGPQLVKIKRVAKAGYFGIASYAKSVTVLSCQLSKSGFRTGLTPEEETYYEQQLNLKPGELGRHSKWWGETFNTNTPIRLKNTKTNELILDNPLAQIKYKVMLEHDKIAKSEIEKNLPGKVFFIDDEEAKSKAELAVTNFKYEGMKLVFKMTPEQKKSALRLFGKKGLDTITEDMSSAQLMQEMEKDPKQFFDIMTDKEIETKGFIHELLEKSLIKRKGNTYTHGEDIIANSTEEAVTFFNDMKNQTVKQSLQSRLAKLKK